MKQFIDCNNITWSVSINVGTIKRVKDLLGINLLESITGNLIEDLKNDPIKLVDILYVLVKNEADTKGISDVAFGESLGGDALENATDAFLDELINFYPTQKKMILQKAFAKIKAAESKALVMGNEYLDKIEIEKQVEKKLMDIFGSVTN